MFNIGGKLNEKKGLLLILLSSEKKSSPCAGFLAAANANYCKIWKWSVATTRDAKIWFQIIMIESTFDSVMGESLSTFDDDCSGLPHHRRHPSSQRFSRVFSSPIWPWSCARLWALFSSFSVRHKWSTNFSFSLIHSCVLFSLKFIIGVNRN